MITVKKPLFSLGRIVATPGRIEALEKAGENAWTYLMRHCQGDYGDVDQEDWQANDEAVKDGGRILSAYTLKSGERIWIITEADRSSSCVMRPDDY